MLADQATDDPRMLTIAEVAARYAVSPGTIVNRAHRGDLPAGIRLGGSRRWPLAALVKFEQEVGAAGVCSKKGQQ